METLDVPACTQRLHAYPCELLDSGTDMCFLKSAYAHTQYVHMYVFAYIHMYMHTSMKITHISYKYIGWIVQALSFTINKGLWEHAYRFCLESQWRCSQGVFVSCCCTTLAWQLGH